jgi:hypothetical protein
MTQLGSPIPPEVAAIRKAVDAALKARGFASIDAESIVTGRDFLLKIWELIVSVPLGIAIVHQDMKPTTMANIFYEMGLMQAYGKETLVIKTPTAVVPSDFIRTEFIEYNSKFNRNIGNFLDGLTERAEYYQLMADQVENNPLLAIDFLRRAYLLTGDDELHARARSVFEAAGLENRARSSVEMLLIGSFGKAA